MKWEPIGTYDGLKKKPQFALFYFKGEPPARGGSGRWSLSPTVEMRRNFGFRECTHWIRIPKPPGE